MGPYTPALRPPRPALKIFRETLPQTLRQQLLSGRDLTSRRRELADPEPLQTAQPQLDRLLGGGLARRSLVELIGRRSCGRFSLVLTLLAAATDVGESTVLVDLGDVLDPQAAVAAGVDLDRLLWLRPRRLEAALAATETVLASGFSLVVLDLGLPPVRGGKGAEGVWLRLARAAQEHEAALLVSTPYRISGSAAAVVLATDRQQIRWQGQGASPRLLAGIASRLTVEKRRGAAPGESGDLGWRTSSLTPLGAPAGERAPLVVEETSAPLPQVARLRHAS